VSVRVPAEFAGLGWEGYETEAITALTNWVRHHPECEVLDIGSSLGLMTLVTLFASDTARVSAFDADLTSLALIERVCRYAPRPERVRRVLGLLSAAPINPATLIEAEAHTALALAKLPGRPQWRNLRYVCLDGTNEKLLPVYSLDSLLAGCVSGPPRLLKIDVEGAELLVLRGADQVVRQASPAILVSVHPMLTGQFAYAPSDVRAWLTERGYSVQVLAVDHEEHWWCEREGGRHAV
jgi:FkbM family methyltransferase